MERHEFENELWFPLFSSRCEEEKILSYSLFCACFYLCFRNKVRILCLFSKGSYILLMTLSYDSVKIPQAIAMLPSVVNFLWFLLSFDMLASDLISLLWLLTFEYPTSLVHLLWWFDMKTFWKYNLMLWKKTVLKWHSMILKRNHFKWRINWLVWRMFKKRDLWDEMGKWLLKF